MRYTNRFVWRCPSTRLVKMYDEHVSAAHLDVGPGTGYYLDRCRFPSQTPALTLLDPNPNVLAAAGARVERYAPSVLAANVLEPIALEAEQFDSIALSHVLHCLPGTIATKARAFEHLEPLLKPGGLIFGSTVLATGVRHNRLSRRVMARLNEKGIFSNTADDRAGARERAGHLLLRRAGDHARHGRAVLGAPRGLGGDVFEALVAGLDPEGPDDRRDHQSGGDQQQRAEDRQVRDGGAISSTPIPPPRAVSTEVNPAEKP